MANLIRHSFSGEAKLRLLSRLFNMTSSANRPLSHRACCSIDQKKLVTYLVGKDEQPIVRPFVPAEKIKWDVSFSDYKPVNYTSSIVLSHPFWSDPEVMPSNTKWNEIDNKIDRRSFMGTYKIVNGLPQNPMGRTGIIGRGLLGRFGPNHAADPIVTRWKLDSNGEVIVHHISGKPILQFVAIQRIDTGQWALPGGMCDPGEKISSTMRREFMEEALNSNQMNEEELDHYKKKIEDVFKNGVEIYRGYVDDPRNTDVSWMETVAFNFHDETGLFDHIRLEAGDDAKHVQWFDIDSTAQLYANHIYFLSEVAKLRNAHW